MLEVTTLAQEEIIGVNFAEYYRNSDLYRYDFYFSSVLKHIRKKIQMLMSTYDNLQEKQSFDRRTKLSSPWL